MDGLKERGTLFRVLCAGQHTQLGRQSVFSLAVRGGGSYWRKVERRTAVNFLWELPRPTPVAAPLPLEHTRSRGEKKQRRTEGKRLNKLTVTASQQTRRSFRFPFPGNSKVL